MSDIIKVLGQTKNATSETALYTVPNLTQTTISTLAICNRTTGILTFRISIAVAGASIDDIQYLFYDAAINPNTTITVTIGITLGQTDVINAWGDATGLSFNVFGVETL